MEQQLEALKRENLLEIKSGREDIDIKVWRRIMEGSNIVILSILRDKFLGVQCSTANK